MTDLDPTAVDPDLATLHAIAALASATDDPAAATRKILRRIAAVFGADSGSLAFQNPETGRLEIEADFGLPADREAAFTPGQGIPGWVAWHGKPLLAADIAGDPRSRPIRSETRCQMAAPLLADDGQVLGVLALDRDVAGAYQPEDLVRLGRLTDEAGRVLRRLWELRHLQGKARQLETLIATGQALVGKLEQRALFDTLTRDAVAMLQARACGFYLHDLAAGTLRLTSFAGQAESPGEDDLPLRSCLIASAVHTRKPIAFADIQSPVFADLSDIPRDRALQSVLAAPMLYEGEVLGVLAIYNDRVRRFDNDEKQLGSALASLGAVALQNVRLYERVFESEASLRKNERLTTLGLLAAEIAHEIRNPLTVLKLLQGGLGVDFPEGDPRKTDLRVMGEKLDQLESIVTRVLNFAKAPTSLHARCSLSEIVDDTLVLMRLKLTQSNIAVRFDAPTRPLVVDGHKGQLQQVLLNLLINAMQAMPEGGEITLGLSSETRGATSYAILDMRDTGTGIPEAIRGRIFDSFLSGRPDGTGLGLAIVQRVLLGHHGDIALVDTGPGGTTFRLRLPLVK